MKKMKKEIDVCIVSYAKNDKLKNITEVGIKSLIESENDIVFNIFVIETNKLVNYDSFKNTQTIYPTEPFGYHTYLNIGIKRGHSDYVFLANNDLTYESGWATEIIKQMDKNPLIMSASPFCPQTQHSSLKSSPVIHGYTVRQQVNGWAIFVKRELFSKIGYLNEYIKYWYSDNDYALTLQINKILHCLVTNSVVNHHQYIHGSTGTEIFENKNILNDYTNKQYGIFINKWKDKLAENS